MGYAGARQGTTTTRVSYLLLYGAFSFQPPLAPAASCSLGMHHCCNEHPWTLVISGFEKFLRLPSESLDLGLQLFSFSPRAAGLFRFFPPSVISKAFHSLSPSVRSAVHCRRSRKGESSLHWVPSILGIFPLDGDHRLVGGDRVVRLLKASLGFRPIPRQRDFHFNPLVTCK